MHTYTHAHKQKNVTQPRLLAMQKICYTGGGGGGGEWGGWGGAPATKDNLLIPLINTSDFYMCLNLMSSLVLRSVFDLSHSKKGKYLVEEMPICLKGCDIPAHTYHTHTHTHTCVHAHTHTQTNTTQIHKAHIKMTCTLTVPCSPSTTFSKRRPCS